MMVQSQPEPSTSANASRLAQLKLRLSSLAGRVVAGRARKLGLAAAVLALLLLAAGLMAWRSGVNLRKRQLAVVRPTLSMALGALARESNTEARLLAEQIERERLKPENLGGPDYVLGVAAAREAEELWGRERKNYFLLAAKHLELAREQGFAQALEPDALLLYGKSLFFAGRIEDSRSILTEALAEAPQSASEIHRLLSEAYRHGPHPDLDRALLETRDYLSDPELSAGDREAGLLAEAQLLWKLKQYADCAGILDQIPADAYIRPEVELLRGRLVLNEARALKSALNDNSTRDERDLVKQRYEQAIGLLRKAQDDPLGIRTIRRSKYLIGVCLQEAGDAQAALTQFQRTRDVYLDTSEGRASALQEADLLLSMNRDDDALTAYRRLLGAIGESVPFTNPWIPSAQFRSRVMAAYQHFFQAEQYERAVAIAERLYPLVPQAQSVRLTAETYRGWARTLLHAADSLPDPQSGQTRAKAREMYRRAGDLFSRLAELEFTQREYPDDVWQSADCYLAGHQFDTAVTALEEYLKYELRRRRPLALVSMGEALLALGRVDESLVALAECIEFYPNDPAGYQARLWAAKGNAEKGDAAAAEALLRENLNGELLTPDSKEWRDSLFTLGKLLAAEGRYPEAIERLEEAVNRYPDSRQANEARYLIAEACQQAAKVPQQKAADDSVETARLAHLKQAQQYLETAIAYYRQTQEVLNRRQEKTELSLLEKAILRNAYFAVGAALVDLGRYDEAVRAYSAATNRYQHDPEVLEAFTQIATCYRRLNKPREARGAVQQAKVVLDRISPDASFADATIYSRRQWKDLLEWLGKL